WQGGAGWGWFGSYWPKLFLVLFLLCSLISWPKRKRLPWLPKKKVKPWMGLISLSVLTVLFGMGVPSTLTARSYNQDKAIHLLFPLRGGTFHVAHGGSNETMNHHFTISAQKYAL